MNYARAACASCVTWILWESEKPLNRINTRISELDYNKPQRGPVPSVSFCRVFRQVEETRSVPSLPRAQKPTQTRRSLLVGSRGSLCTAEYCAASDQLLQWTVAAIAGRAAATIAGRVAGSRISTNSIADPTPGTLSVFAAIGLSLLDIACGLPTLLDLPVEYLYLLVFAASRIPLLDSFCGLLVLLEIVCGLPTLLDAICGLLVLPDISCGPSTLLDIFCGLPVLPWTNISQPVWLPEMMRTWVPHLSLENYSEDHCKLLEPHVTELLMVEEFRQFINMLEQETLDLWVPLHL